jgi:cobalt-zinc-cadmium efflux system membrane fusion protein
MRKALILLLVCGWSCSRNDNTGESHEAGPKQKKQPTEVVLPAQQAEGVIGVEILASSNEPELLQAPGKISLADQSSWRIGVLTSGRVEKVYVNLGDIVQEGQLLAGIHSHDVHEARAAYQTARSDLSRAETAAALAQKNYERAERLYSLKAGSLGEVDRARQEQANAQAAVRNEQIELEKERVHLEGNLGVAADPGPEIPEDKADLVPVRAAGSGYVLSKNVTPGTVVDPTKDLFVIGDLKRVWMIASVGEANIGKLRAGQVATVRTTAYPSDRFEGRVTNLGPELDPVTRVMRVRIALENPALKLRPEMLATAEIRVGGSRSLLLVPADAVQQINDQDVVFIQKSENRFQLRPVRLGDMFNERVVILEGVQAGDAVVTRGSFILKSQLLKSSLESE